MTKLNKPVLVALALSVGLSVVWCRSAIAQGSYDELCQRFTSTRDSVLEQLEKATDEKEQQALWATYPSSTMVDDFLSFEREHRGTQEGLSALHHLVSQAGSGGAPTSLVAKGRQAALAILTDHYAEHPDIDVMFDWLGSGTRGPADKPFLKRVSTSPHRHVRGAALLALAKSHAKEVLLPAILDAMLALLEKQPDNNREDLVRLKELKSWWHDVDPVASRQAAVELLAKVRTEYGDVLEAPRTPYGPILIKVERSEADEFTKQTRRTVGDLAGTMAFELNHLAIGREAPEITQESVAGQTMKLSDYRGKTLMLMFSFKGCGPCEAMYPGNRKLLEEYAGRPFAIVSVMGDETIDTVSAAIADGTITWPVWWDGSRPGPIASRWNVRGWPEIYLVDHRGIIRYRELRGDMLNQAVAELVQKAEQNN